MRGIDLEPSRQLAREAARRLEQLGLRRLHGSPAPQMVALELPEGAPDDLQQRLYDEHQVEVLVREWEGRRLLRVSVAPYNDESDLDRLCDALATR